MLKIAKTFGIVYVIFLDALKTITDSSLVYLVDQTKDNEKTI